MMAGWTDTEEHRKGDCDRVALLTERTCRSCPVVELHTLSR